MNSIIHHRYHESGLLDDDEEEEAVSIDNNDAAAAANANASHSWATLSEIDSQYSLSSSRYSRGGGGGGSQRSLRLEIDDIDDDDDDDEEDGQEQDPPVGAVTSRGLFLHNEQEHQVDPSSEQETPRTSNQASLNVVQNDETEGQAEEQQHPASC